MTWFPDRSSCQTWGGPEFRLPFTEASFREDAKLQQLPSFGLMDEGDFVGFGQYYRRLEPLPGMDGVVYMVASGLVP